MAAAISVNLAATAVPADVTATTATIAISAIRSAYSSRSCPSSLRVRTAARKFVMRVMSILLRDRCAARGVRCRLPGTGWRGTASQRMCRDKQERLACGDNPRAGRRLRQVNGPSTEHEHQPVRWWGEVQICKLPLRIVMNAARPAACGAPRSNPGPFTRRRLPPIEGMDKKGTRLAIARTGGNVKRISLTLRARDLVTSLAGFL